LSPQITDTSPLLRQYPKFRKKKCSYSGWWCDELSLHITLLPGGLIFTVQSVGTASPPSLCWFVLASPLFCLVMGLRHLGFVSLNLASTPFSPPSVSILPLLGLGIAFAGFAFWFWFNHHRLSCCGGQWLWLRYSGSVDTVF
ncbi:hypothetical protein A2U01_0026146, partial [Trifolium medium]|nr:hypothetical protein [Trifolium medium]